MTGKVFIVFAYYYNTGYTVTVADLGQCRAFEKTIESKVSRGGLGLFRIGRAETHAAVIVGRNSFVQLYKGIALFKICI